LGWVGSISWWIGLGWVKKNGPTSISDTARTYVFLTPVRMGHIRTRVEKCTRTYGPYIRAVRTGAFFDTRTYGP